VKGATLWQLSGEVVIIISIHAPCEGSDYCNIKLQGNSAISIHAPCEGSDKNQGEQLSMLEISIHAPCEGSDIDTLNNVVVDVISIHAPCEGSDTGTWDIGISLQTFQSTLPVKGATIISQSQTV